MIKASDYSGVIPYGQECEAAIVKLLPVGTYVMLTYPKAPGGPLERLARVARWDAGPPAPPDTAIEHSGSVYYFSLTHNHDVIVTPLTDQDALAKVPVGSKVTIFAVDPSLGTDTRFVNGLVVGHLKRRLRVVYTFNDGTPGERDLYVSQLVKF